MPTLFPYTTLFRSQVEFSALQPFVGGQDYDQRERDDEQEKHSTEEPRQTSIRPPGYESREGADHSEWNLHQGASLVAGPPLRHRYLDATGKPRRMLHNVDVHGGTGKDA